MDKRALTGIVSDLLDYENALPEEMHPMVQRLNDYLSRHDEEQVSMATDGVVNGPANEQTYDEDDLNFLVYRVYAGLNDYVEEHRSEGVDDGLQSIFTRLRGEVDSYERDFP